MISLPHADARLVDASTGRVVEGEGLVDLVDAARAWLRSAPPGVMFLSMDTSVRSIADYLGAWAERRPVALLDPRMDEDTVAGLIERYRPALVIRSDQPSGQGADPAGYEPGVRDRPSVRIRSDGHAAVAHGDLAILLTTSGSTGDPKLVRLSRSAIESNTAAIVQALEITRADVTISTLPFFYSFGMSVLNTHLAAGATMVLTDDGLLARTFWETVDRYRVTSLSMVPTQYQILRRIGFDPANHPSITVLTQAGGHLGADVVVDFHRRMTSVNGRLYIMYGQTEAGPRLTTLPPTALPQAAGSVGPAVPGGQLAIEMSDGTETTTAGLVGEVIYRGPNVMMGYASAAEDLCLGDILGGRLATGDLGKLDSNGYLTIEGRLNRIGKIFGVRVNLDDIERMISAHSGQRVAAVASDDRVVVWIEGDEPSLLDEAVRMVARRLRLHWTGLEVRSVAAFPTSPSGKIDYRALRAPR